MCYTLSRGRHTANYVIYGPTQNRRVSKSANHNNSLLGENVIAYCFCQNMANFNIRQKQNSEIDLFVRKYLNKQHVEKMDTQNDVPYNEQALNLFLFKGVQV